MKTPQSSSPESLGFKILREEIDDHSVRHLTVSFPLQHGGTETTRIKRGLLFEPAKARIHFADLGAELPSNSRSLFAALGTERPAESYRITEAAGWHGTEFVTRYGTYTDDPANARTLFSSDSVVHVPALRSGTSKAYSRGIRRFLIGSDFVALSMIAGLTPAAAAFIGRSDGFGICLSQQTSTGKTLSIRVAQSISSRAEERDLVSFGDTLGATLNSLAAFGGSCICFDDIKSEVTSKAAVEKIRVLTFNGATGKPRQRLNSARLPTFQFVMPLLSTETPLSNLFAENSQNFEGGEAVRLINLRVPPAHEGGIFARTGPDTSASMVRDLEAFLVDNHGTALPLWVRQLLHVGRDRTSKAIAEYEVEFLNRLGSLPPAHGRIAKRFALLAAVGRVAGLARIVPLSAEEVASTMERLYRNCIGVMARGQADILELWRTFFATLANTSRVVLAEGGRPVSSDPGVGFRRKEGGHTFVYLKRKPLIDHLGVAFVDQYLLPQLRSVNAIKHQKSEDLTVPVKQKGISGRPRYYRIDAAALELLKTELLTVGPQ